MDRHQFVEKLIEKRDLLRTKAEDLSREKDKAYKKSLTRLKEMLKEKPDETLRIDWGDASGCSISYIDPMSENARVTDEDIIALCGEISDLEKQVAKLEAEAKKLQGENISKMFTED